MIGENSFLFGIAMFARRLIAAQANIRVAFLLLAFGQYAKKLCAATPYKC